MEDDNGKKRHGELLTKLAYLFLEIGELKAKNLILHSLSNLSESIARKKES